MAQLTPIFSARFQPPTCSADRRVSTSRTPYRKSGTARLSDSGSEIGSALNSGTDSRTSYESSGLSLFNIFSRIFRADPLSMGRLPEPHLGECTQAGQPVSHGQPAMMSKVFSRSDPALLKAASVNPSPPRTPS